MTASSEEEHRARREEWKEEEARVQREIDGRAKNMSWGLLGIVVFLLGAFLLVCVLLGDILSHLKLMP